MPNKKTGPVSDPGSATGRAVELIRDSHVMTLATASNDGPWAAPVYYYYKNRAFFFFSSEAARHIRDIARVLEISTDTVISELKKGNSSRPGEFRTP